MGNSDKLVEEESSAKIQSAFLTYLCSTSYFTLMDTAGEFWVACVTVSLPSFLQIKLAHSHDDVLHATDPKRCAQLHSKTTESAHSQRSVNSLTQGTQNYYAKSYHIRWKSIEPVTKPILVLYTVIFEESRACYAVTNSKAWWTQKVCLPLASFYI